MSSKSKLTFVDLFCGIGGFHQVLADLGHQCVLACDIDKHCRQVYFDNYGIMPHDDITTLDPQVMPDFDILCGGFPCQPFSNGGKKQCFNDKRGLLFDEIMRIVKVKQPKFMFLENVKHILKVSDGQVMSYIEQQIANHGYYLKWFEISPHQYGIPQQRSRIYFVCIRNDIYQYANSPNIVLPKYPNNSVKPIASFLQPSSEVDIKYNISAELNQVLEAWDEVIKTMSVGQKLSPTLLIADHYKVIDLPLNYTDPIFKQFPLWKQQYLLKTKDLFSQYKVSVFDKWYQQHQNLLSKRQIYSQLEWQCGSITHNDSIFNHIIQIRQSGIRVKTNKYFPTLVALAQIPIYGPLRRTLTPRECARLQCFPDSFKLPDNDRTAYKQLGNSINIDNARLIITTTLNLIKIVSN